MPTIEVTADTFNDVVSTHDLVLVDFWAAWCGPCRVFAPIFEWASEQHPEIAFAKVDTEAEQELAAAFGITSIPTIAVIRDGIVLYAAPGALPAQLLEDLIEKAGSLDMDEVRRQIAAAAPAS